MERSGKNMKQVLRENVARFLEHADGREVIINVTARLVKKRQSDAPVVGLIMYFNKTVKMKQNRSSNSYDSKNIVAHIVCIIEKN